MLYAIISTLYDDRDRYKDFHVLIHSLTIDQVKSIYLAHLKAEKIMNEERKHRLSITVYPDGFDYSFSGDTLFEMGTGYVIPMWDMKEFFDMNK